MEVMKITEWGLLVIVISLAIITFNQLRLYAVEQAYRRAKRKIQRDKNSKYIEILELQVSQLEERLSCVETNLYNRGK